MSDRPLFRVVEPDAEPASEVEAEWLNRRRALDHEPRCLDVSALPRYARTRHRGLSKHTSTNEGSARDE